MNSERIISHNQRLNNLSLEIDNLPTDKDLINEYAYFPINTNIPYTAYNRGAEFLDDILYIFGGVNTATANEVYSWDGSTWTELESLSISSLSKFTHGKTVIYNNLIHVLGSDDTTGGSKSHYTFNGSKWTAVGSLPTTFINNGAVVYDNKIHILGNSTSKNHYVYDGSSWTKMSVNLPISFQNGCAVVYNNEIHILGGSNNYTNHYKWNGSSWTQVSTLPYIFRNGSALVFDEAIHIFGTDYPGENGKIHYKWDGSSWTYVGILPYEFSGGNMLEHNGDIHILGGRTSYYYSDDRISYYNILRKIYRKAD